MSSGPETVVANVTRLTDQGGFTLSEARDELLGKVADHVGDGGVSVYQTEYSTAYSNSVDLFLSACDERAASSESAVALAQDLRYHREYELTRLRHYHGVNSEMMDFDQWSDDDAGVRAVIRWCVAGLYVGNDRVVENASRLAGRHGALRALRSIVPVEEPDRFTLGAGHGVGLARDLLEELDPEYLSLVDARGQDHFGL